MAGNASLRQGRHWQDKGFTRTTDPTEQPGETHFTRITAEQERPLRNLVADGLIRWGTKDLVIAAGSRTGGHALELAVTNQGRKRARRLHTLAGLIELWYEEHKSGALLAALTGLGGLAVFIVDHWGKIWPWQK